MATKKPVLPDELQAKLEAFCRTHDTTPEKVIALALHEWLADYDRGRWPHSHSFVEPNPGLVG